MTVPEKLKLIQKLTGYSQEKLARDLGVSFPTLNSWINGRSLPRKRALLGIDEFYRHLTGQHSIPESALTAKKQLIKRRVVEEKNLARLILKNRDVYDQFVLSLTYHSNRIEGSTLSEPETAAVLFENATLPDKSVIEHMEVKNHQAALHTLFKHLAGEGKINEAFVLRLHGILMNGIEEDAGCYRRRAVRIAGANVPTANYLKVPSLMKDLFKGTEASAKDILARAAVVHSRFEQIHPFSDGNGRIGRLWVNAMLLRHRLPPAIIRQEKRRFYILYLNKAQLKDDTSLLEDFLCDAVLEGFDILGRWQM